MDEDDHRRPQMRSEPFADRVGTRICRELPDPHNPYLTAGAQWHGYDVLELMEYRSFSDVLYLLVSGELPEREQSRLLERILIALANPGPRHAAVRGVMSASVSRARPEHLLPIGMGLMGGCHDGAALVYAAARFLHDERHRDPAQLGGELVAQGISPPGFGRSHGGVDRRAAGLAAALLGLHPEATALAWGEDLCRSLATAGQSWLMAGVAAAVFVQLGLSPAAAAGLYQLAAGPGLLAHGLELRGQPLTAMPFVADEHYHYEGPVRPRRGGPLDA